MFKKIGIVVLALAVLFTVYLFFQAKNSQNDVAYQDKSAGLTLGLAEDNIQRIAFGSCNRQDKPQAYWETIATTQPDQWIWLGDNIYGDTEDPAELAGHYARQKSAPEYQAFTGQCAVYGIYDDHDYGLNDGGKNWSIKDTAASLLFDFLDVPLSAAARKTPGTYQTYLLGEGERQVRLILLDTRYFRDDLQKSSDPNQRYEINETGDILGEAQWEWLANTLRNNEAAITLIGSSIQFITDEHGYEKWSLFPTAKARLLALLHEVQPKNTFLLSGDRHLAEIAEATIAVRPEAAKNTVSQKHGYFVSPIETNDTAYQIREITSSGLTHSYQEADEANRFRTGPLIGEQNFGLLTIDWAESNAPVLLFQLLSTEDGHEFSRLAYAGGARLSAEAEAALSFINNNMNRTLKPCPDSPNCVSTQTSQEKKKMQPLSYSGDMSEAVAKLKVLVEDMPRTKLVTAEDGYLHFTFKTIPIPFIDDVEFLFDDEQKQIHFRSASRVGYSDMGVNARRMKKVTRRWEALTAN